MSDMDNIIDTRSNQIADLTAERDSLREEVERLKKEVAGSLIPHSARCMEMEKALVAESEVRRLREDLFNAKAYRTNLEAKYARLKTLAENALEYCVHDRECILSQWSAGEPTPDGGYRTKYAGKWYQSRPVDETPECNCGCDDAVNAYRSFVGEKEKP